MAAVLQAPPRCPCGRPARKAGLAASAPGGAGREHYPYSIRWYCGQVLRLVGRKAGACAGCSRRASYCCGRPPEFMGFCDRTISAGRRCGSLAYGSATGAAAPPLSLPMRYSSRMPLTCAGREGGRNSGSGG